MRESEQPRMKPLLSAASREAVFMKVSETERKWKTGRATVASLDAAFMSESVGERRGRKVRAIDAERLAAFIIVSELDRVQKVGMTRVSMIGLKGCDRPRRAIG